MLWGGLWVCQMSSRRTVFAEPQATWLMVCMLDGDFRPSEADNTVDTASAATRNQVMGHTEAWIFEAHYFSRHIRFDVQGAVSGDIPTSLVAHSVSMGAYADPNAPFKLTNEQRKTAHQHQAVLAKEVVLQDLKKDLSSRFGTVRKSHGTLEFTAYREAFRAVRRERVRQERLLFKRLRQQYFAESSQDEITRQLTEAAKDSCQDILPDTSTRVPARKAYAETCYVAVPAAKEESTNRELRYQALTHLIELCHQQDGCWIGSRKVLQPTRDGEVEIEDKSEDVFASSMSVNQPLRPCHDNQREI